MNSTDLKGLCPFSQYLLDQSKSRYFDVSGTSTAFSFKFNKNILKYKILKVAVYGVSSGYHRLLLLLAG